MNITKITNAIKRGTAFGAVLAALIGCMAYEAELAWGIPVIVLGVAYFSLFIGVNHERM